MKTIEQVQKELKYGYAFGAKEFYEYIVDGDFLPYDGSGYFHDGEKKTDLRIWDDSVTEEDFHKYPYIIWYNR